MKQIYELSQQLIAGLLIVSIFIQSCTYSITTAISKEEEPILEILSQVSNEGSVKQLAVSKFIPKKEHEAVLASQAEELGNANHQGEALLTAKGEKKVEEHSEQESGQGVANDAIEAKEDELANFIEVNVGNYNQESTSECLGKLGILPIEVVERILTYVPCDHIKKGNGGEQIVTGIFAVRQINHLFYELTTGYSQPGLVGVEHRPNRCVHLEACMISNIISFDKLNPATIPSFIFYQFIRKVADLPKVFWPYLQGTNVHTLFVETRLLVEILEIVKNLEGTKIHTLDFSNGYVGRYLGAELGKLAKSLQRTKVYIVNLYNSCMKGEGAVEFAKNLKGTQVHTLDVSNNDIGDNFIGAFAKNLQYTQVHTLDISRSNIGDKGIREFAENLECMQLHTLDISRNNIGDEGIVEFAKRLQGTKVCRINLMGNKIGKVGLIEFAKNLIGTEVKEININHNKISWNKIKSTQEILEFGQILATTKVRKVDFRWCNILPGEHKLLVRKYPHIDWKYR